VPSGVTLGHDFGADLGTDLSPAPGSGGGGGTLALDLISVPALCAVSACRKLRSAYGGPCMRVRRSSDSTQQDIGFLGNVLDQAALLAFVGAGSGYVITLYDQGPAARHLTQADPLKQPIVVNAGVRAVTTGTGSLGVGTMLLDASRTLERPDACGLTGAPALTMGARFRSTNTAGNPAYCRIGATGFATPSGWLSMMASGAANILYVGHTNAPAFNVAAWAGLGSAYYVVRAAAGERNDQHHLRQNGADCGLNSIAGNGALPLNLTNGITAMGGGAGPAAGNVRDAPGDINALMLFGAELTGTDLTAFDTELAAHR
jgi:hypothetical protein